MSRGPGPGEGTLDAALAYAARGWPVLPLHSVRDRRCTCARSDRCESAGKHPLNPHGVAEAATDAATIRKWWTRWPFANVGIATGQKSFVVLDIDPRHGGDMSLQDLEAQHGRIPQTPESLTGGGGRHLCFAPAGCLVRNKAGFAPGLDIRGDGGYIVAPPSVHASGKSYVWEGSSGPEAVAFAPLPDWLLELIGGEIARPAAPTQPTDSTIVHGARNATLTSLAGSMRRRGMTSQSIAAALQAENASRCRPPLDDVEVANIARSVGRYPSAETNEPWGTPVPFLQPEPESFPTEALPSWIRRWVVAEAEAIQVPVDLPALLALAVCALALMRKLEVTVHPGWDEPLNVYVVVALPPGEGKSPVFRHAMAAIRKFEQEERQRAARDCADAEKRADKASERVKLLKKATARLNTDGEKKDAEEELARAIAELDAIERPVIPRLTADDITAEALASLLMEQKGRIGIFSAEGGPFELMAGRYSDGRSNFEVYLKAYSGDFLSVDRISRAGGIVRYPALTMALTVQPAVIAGLMAKEGFRGKGLLARFWYALPKSRVGNRKANPPFVPAHVRSEYEARVVDLMRFPSSFDPVGEFAPRQIRIAADALDVLYAFKAELEPRLGPEGDLHSLADWANKLTGSVVRLAGLLHIAECWSPDNDSQSPSISRDVMERAIVIGRYLLAHAIAAFDAMGADERTETSKYVLAAICRRGEPTLRKREVFRMVQRYVKSVEDLDPILETLVNRGFLREVPAERRTSPGRPRNPSYDVNPCVLEPAKTVTKMTKPEGGGGPVESAPGSGFPLPNDRPEDADFEEGDHGGEGDGSLPPISSAGTDTLPPSDSGSWEDVA